MTDIFEPTKLYSKQEIQQICKGGNPNASIGVIREKVLFVCVDPEVNPSFLYGPEAYGLEVNKRAYIVGNGPTILKSAEVLMNFRDTFPLFIKTSNKWKYLGQFKSCGFSYSPDEISKHEVNAKNLTDKNQAVVFLMAASNIQENSDELAINHEFKKVA